jgi:hypothetical protein
VVALLFESFLVVCTQILWTSQDALHTQPRRLFAAPHGLCMRSSHTGTDFELGRSPSRHLRCCPDLQRLRRHRPPTSTCRRRCLERSRPPARQAYTLFCLRALLLPPDRRVCHSAAGQLHTICGCADIPLVDRISSRTVPALEILPASWIRQEEERYCYQEATVAIYLVGCVDVIYIDIADYSQVRYRIPISAASAAV